MRKCMIELFRFHAHPTKTASKYHIFRCSSATKSASRSQPNKAQRAQLKSRAEGSSFAALFNEIAEILGTENFGPTSEVDISVTEAAKSKIAAERENLSSCGRPVCENVLEDEFETAGGADVSTTVREITAIVRSGSGSVPMEERLESSGLLFEPRAVEMVLKRCFKVPHLAMRFFDWVKLRDEFSHTTETYNTMLYIAGEAKEFAFVEKLVEEMEASSCQKNLKTWTILISHYGRAKLIGKALLVFEKMRHSGFKPDFAVYSEILRALCVARNADVAMEFYKEMVLKEMNPSLGLYKTLLNCIAITGDADAVHLIADDMVRFLQIPENTVYGLVLKSFCISGKITEALEMIRIIKNRGLSFGPEQYGTLVKGLCRAGRVEDALEILDIMKRRNLTDGDIYGMIVNGYLQKKDVSRALDLFQNMKENGHVPSRSTYTALIQTLLQSKEYEKGRELFDEMLERGVEPDSVAFMAIVAGHVSHDNVSEAWRMFKVMEEKGIKPTHKFYSVFINELCKKARNNEIIKVLNEMRASKVVIGNKVFQRVICHLEKKGEMETLEKVRKLQEADKLSFQDAEELHTLSKGEHFTESSFSQPHLRLTGSDSAAASSPAYSEDDVKEVSKILMSSSDWSLIQEALEKLSMKFTPSSVLAVLHDCKIHGHTALNFFNWVGKQEGYSHTTETYNMAIKIAGCGKSFRHMRSLFYEMKRNRILITPHTWTIMIMVYGRTGLTEVALKVFNEMESSGYQPTRSTYKYLIVSLCGRKGRKVDRAVKLFHEMVKRDYVPDKELIETYVSCLCATDRLLDATRCVEYLGKVGFTTELRYALYVRALCRNGKLEEAQKLMNEIGADREKLNTYVYGSIVHGLLRKGQFKEALDKVEEMKRVGINPTVHVYTSLINHFFKEKQIEKAVEILDKMQMEGCEPTVVTYSAVIRGYMNAKKVDQAQAVFTKMRDKGPFPDFRTYSIFIDCLCKAGRSEAALKLMSEMFDRGIAPSSVNFRTVFFGLNREGKRGLAQTVLQQKKALVRRRQFVT
ncbi:putative pentatricopeptide repeat-containing protein At5g06400, mitochondrial [Punica granatum]|uniref:Pentatricopeptide repeat-containing protein At5g06400, mitochondrial n=3 Tax=Punica granatum TaxID=22663 RepID=A0A218XCD2_PUNGR|nr:putative pentatricopeptide repeat-containing protein At5g06400, mitochondrial [Punica granatum]OWM82603.1 hypothetical protein CDL15_Pgr002178 [Punica granatum]